jgi:hypothetical protein
MLVEDFFRNWVVGPTRGERLEGVARAGGTCPPSGHERDLVYFDAAASYD